jgi:hypothetical protein
MFYKKQRIPGQFQLHGIGTAEDGHKTERDQSPDGYPEQKIREF